MARRKNSRAKPPGTRIRARRERSHIISGDRVLIVCEGEKTERIYLETIRNRLRLHSAQVCVVGAGGDPTYVVRRAQSEVERAKTEGELAYDQIWCVFDRDTHARHAEACNNAKNSGFKLALSAPCFEIWYLLYFTASTRPYQNCNAVIKELKKYLGKRYNKAAIPFANPLEGLDGAISNAHKLRKYLEGTGATNPYTNVDLLMGNLRELKHG